MICENDKQNNNFFKLKEALIQKNIQYTFSLVFIFDAVEFYVGSKVYRISSFFLFPQTFSCLVKNKKN